MTHRRSSTVAAAACLALACSEPSRDGNEAASASNHDAAVYQLALDTLERQAERDRAPLITTRLPRSPEGDRSSVLPWLRSRLPGVSPEMYAQVHGGSEPAASLQTVFADVPGVEWIDTATLRRSYDIDRTIRRGLWLSPIGYNADSTMALVYIDLQCGALCGSADYVLLSRRGSGSWKVDGTVMRLIR